MKAARFSQFGGPDVLEIVDLPDPHPGPNQVRIAVRAAGVSLSDWKKRSGVLPQLIELAGGPEHVVTVADFSGAQKYGVRFSRGDSGRAFHVLAEIGELIESGRFLPPHVRTFPLAEIAEAHQVSEAGQARGKLVLLVGDQLP